MNKALALLAIVACAPLTLEAQLEDAFSGASIDTDKWNVLLPFTNQVISDWRPHNVTSSASLANGELLLNGGAFVTSRQSFTSPYVYSGTFNQTSLAGGRTMISLRGDGTSFEPSYGGPNGNILLFFFGDPNNTPNYKVQIAQSTTASPYSYQAVTETYRNNDFPLSMDSPTTFSITDYGTNIEVTINNVLVSRAVVRADDFGGHVSIASQWSDSGALKVDNIGVHQLLDTTDADNDGVNYYREGKDGTDPNDPTSFNSLSKGLVAYYPFNGNADDESGNKRNGVATAITYDTDITGRPASSAVFANGSAVDIPSLTGFQFRPVTYSLWVYFSNIQSNRETTLIGRKRAWAQSDGGVTVETRWAVNNELKYSTGGTIITSGFEFDIGQWYHIVFTQDAQSEASFYVNGELLSSQPFTAVQDTDTFPFRLGAESALDGISSGEGIFNGQMDKVRIYDRALSAQEVTSLYTSEPDMADSDADGLYDFLETQIGTDPNNPDTDGDGLKDGAEHLLADLGFSPLDNNSAQAVTLFSDPNKTFLFTQAQYDLNRSNGQSDVTTSPSTFSLFTQNQVSESYTQGQNSVLQSIPSVDFSVPESTPLRVTLSGQNVIGVVVDDTESPLPDNWRLDEQAGQLIGSVVGSNSISVVLEGEMAGDAPAIRIPLTFYPQAGQTIAPFARIPTQAFRLAPLTVTPPAASSGFAVVLSVKSGPATIVDNQVTFTGLGKVVLAANQVGNKDMKAAPEVTTSFLVTKGRQNMSFPPLNSMPFVQGGTFQLSATTTSALPIAYSSSNPRVISISGSTATIVGRGVATIRATQSGDSNWAPATPISRATRIY